MTFTRSSPIRALYVSAAPNSVPKVTTNRELRAISRCIERGGRRRVELDVLLASTLDDLRRRLLERQFDLIHFTTHASVDGGFLLESEVGAPVFLAPEALARLLASHCAPRGRLRWLVLNGCSTLALAEPLRGLEGVIGTNAPVDDLHAESFSRGFYDALVHGCSFARAFEEGQSSVALLDTDSSSMFGHIGLAPERIPPRGWRYKVRIQYESGSVIVAYLGVESLSIGRSRRADFALPGASRDVGRVHAWLRLRGCGGGFMLSATPGHKLQCDGRVYRQIEVERVEALDLGHSLRLRVRARQSPCSVSFIYRSATLPSLIATCVATPGVTTGLLRELGGLKVTVGVWGVVVIAPRERRSDGSSSPFTLALPFDDCQHPAPGISKIEVVQCPR